MQHSSFFMQVLIPRGLSLPHPALWLTTQGREILYSIWKGRGRLEEAVISSFQFCCSYSKLKVGKSTGQCCSSCSSMRVQIWLPRSWLAISNTCHITKMGGGRRGCKHSLLISVQSLPTHPTEWSDAPLVCSHTEYFI